VIYGWDDGGQTERRCPAGIAEEEALAAK
jgi:hypothetical protein